MADKKMSDFTSSTSADTLYCENSNGNQVKVKSGNIMKRRSVSGTASTNQSITVSANYGALITVYYGYLKQVGLFIRTGETSVTKIAGTLSSSITLTASGDNVVIKSASGNYGVVVTVQDAYN